MPTSDFQKTSWGWQFDQFQQQVGEWVELQLSRLKPSVPKGFLPDIDAPWLGELLKAVAWLLLSLVIIWLSWQLWRQFNPVVYSWLSQTEKASITATTSLNELTVTEWLQRSQSYFRQGNYREACRCLYLGMLQRLNDTGIALNDPSRTDGEYLQLLQQLPRSQPYQTLITTHEQLYFGASEILPETFDRCRQAYREISGE